MPIRPSNPFAAIVASIFPELAGAGSGGGMQPPGAPPSVPFQDGPPANSLDEMLMGLMEQPGAARGFSGIAEPLTRGQKLMPQGEYVIPGMGYRAVVPNFGADRLPNDPIDQGPATAWKHRPGGPASDPNNPFSWHPAGFRMNSPGGSVNSGKGFGYPAPGNDNAGGGSGKGSPGNDNGAPPIPFPVGSYGPQGNGPKPGAANQNGKPVIPGQTPKFPANQNNPLMDVNFFLSAPGTYAQSGIAPARPPKPANQLPKNVVPLTKAGYSPQQDALIEQGLDPNGVQAAAYAQLPGGQKDSPITIEPKKQPVVASQGNGASARDIFIRKVIGAESGGRANAKNPKSSALGLGQFITGTWIDIMRKHPELRLTPEGRTDPTQATRALYALTADNEAYLTGKGIPISPGTLYAAHFLGAGGAVRALRASDDKPMSSVVDPGVVASNPFLAQMTVGNFRQWTERKMAAGGYDRGPSGSGPGANPPALVRPPEGGIGGGNYTAGLTPDEQTGTGGKGGNGSAEVQSEQATSGPIQQEDGSAFAPYLQELAQRRAAYKQRAADRRSRLEELISLGDQRGQNNAQV